MTVPNRTSVLGVFAAATLALGACEQAVAPGSLVPVRFQMAAITPVGSRAAASGASAPLEISTVQLVVGRASLGSGAEFGCHDCEGNFSDPQMTPKLADLPTGGGRVDVVTEQVSAGRYGQAELSLERPVAATLAGVTDWTAGATMRISGKFNGVPFTLDLDVQGSLRGALVPPLDVATGAVPSSVSVVIKLPVDTWFVSGGRALDPANATDRASIAANVRASFGGVEAEAASSE